MNKKTLRKNKTAFNISYTNNKNPSKKWVYFNWLLFGLIIFAGIGYATTISENGFTMTNNGNITSVNRYNGHDMRLEGENVFIRMVSTQAGERSAMQWYNGSQIMLSIECHGLNDSTHAGDPETHCGIYGSNSTGSTKKIFNIQWGYDINNITLENGAFGKSLFDFNDAPIYNANFSAGRINSGMHLFRADATLTIQDTDTSLSTAMPTLQFAESGAGSSIDNHWNITTSNDFSLTIKNPINRWITINRTNGKVELGTSTAPVNLTMYSGNGTKFNCGVNNSGAFSCT